MNMHFYILSNDDTKNNPNWTFTWDDCSYAKYFLSSHSKACEVLFCQFYDPNTTLIFLYKTKDN